VRLVVAHGTMHSAVTVSYWIMYVHAMALDGPHNDSPLSSNLEAASISIGPLGILARVTLDDMNSHHAQIVPDIGCDVDCLASVV